MGRATAAERWRGTSRQSLRVGGDRGVLYGATVAGVLILVGMLASGSILSFFDVGSLLVVLGGTIGATMIQCSTADLRNAFQSLKTLRHDSAVLPSERMQQLLRLSFLVKREGLLVLDQESGGISDPFVRLGIELAVDATPANEIRRILELELRTSQERSERGVQVFETMGTYAPALGLIGTLIGLIQMLGVLDNPAALGPAMALALVTTFYGAIFANLVCLPIAGRLRNQYREGTLVKAITVEGIISIAGLESPIVLEQRFRSFRPGAQALSVSGGFATAEGA